MFSFLELAGRKGLEIYTYFLKPGDLRGALVALEVLVCQNKLTLVNFNLGLISVKHKNNMVSFRR